MLDIIRIRNNKEEVEKALLKRNFRVDFTELLEWDAKRRQNIYEVEQMKAKKNVVSNDIPKLKKQGQDVSDLLDEMKILSTKISSYESDITELETKIREFLEVLPNTPAPDVEAGDETHNKPVKYIGEKPVFDFAPKDHVTLCEHLDMIDYKRGVKMGGNGFWIYKKNGA